MLVTASGKSCGTLMTNPGEVLHGSTALGEDPPVMLRPAQEILVPGSPRKGSEHEGGPAVVIGATHWHLPTYSEL